MIATLLKSDQLQMLNELRAPLCKGFLPGFFNAMQGFQTISAIVAGHLIAFLKNVYSILAMFQHAR